MLPPVQDSKPNSKRLRPAVQWMLCFEGRSIDFGFDLDVIKAIAGRRRRPEEKRAYHHKMKVLSLIDRETRQARSMVVDDLKPSTIAPILRENMSREARLATDEAGHYLHVGKEFADHGIVRHGQEEYVVGDVHTNTLEGYFSVFKRGMKGVYHIVASAICTDIWPSSISGTTTAWR